MHLNHGNCWCTWKAVQMPEQPTKLKCWFCRKTYQNKANYKAHWNKTHKHEFLLYLEPKEVNIVGEKIKFLFHIYLHVQNFMVTIFDIYNKIFSHSTGRTTQSNVHRKEGSWCQGQYNYASYVWKSIQQGSICYLLTQTNSTGKFTCYANQNLNCFYWNLRYFDIFIWTCLTPIGESIH